MKPPARTSKSEGGLFPQAPPPRVLRWTAGWLLLLFAAAATATVVVRLPETIVCPFVIVPQQGTDPVVAPVTATVLQVKVAEGEVVPAGAELFVLHSDGIRDGQTLLRTLQQEVAATAARRRRLDDMLEAQIRIRTEELRQVEQEVTFREQYLATRRDFLGRSSKLAADGLISQVEFLEHQLEAAEAEKDLVVVQRSQQQVRLEIQQSETERSRQQADLDLETEKLTLRIRALEQQLRETREEGWVIRAPYPAVVLSLAHRNPGAVVRDGEQLAQLARLEGDLRARLVVGEQGLPRLAVPQRVRLFFEAFPYQRHGTLTGQLEWVSPAAVGSGAAQEFVARATLDRPAFGSGERSRPLRPGMKGQARITVGTRRVIELAFEPLRQVREQLAP